MAQNNRCSESYSSLPSLENRCQLLVWTPDDAKELQKILRSAPVRFGENISSDDMISLAYLSNSDDWLNSAPYELQDTGIEDLKLSDRAFDKVVEVHIDTTENIPREYESAIKGDWLVHDYEGKSVVGRNQLEFSLEKARNLEIYEHNPSGRILVAYNQGSKDHLLSFQLYDQETFSFPWTESVSRED